MELLSQKAEELFAHLQAHPDQAYLSIAGVFACMLLGVILGRKRTYDPRGSSRSVRAHNRMGARGYRVSVGIGYGVGMIGALVARYFTK